MALTATEEALIRELLNQQAAILSLASAESTIISKLGATKVTLSDLVAASTVADADLLLMRQGTNDKSVTAKKLAEYIALQVGIPTAVAGGTADAITTDFTPNVALTNGITVIVRAGAANATTTPTFAPDGLTAKTIVKGNSLALAAGDIAGAGHWLEMNFDTALDKWVLQNPANSSGSLLNIQIFTGSATYTPTPGTKSVEVEIQAPGGGSGGTAATGAGQASMSPPGGAGSWGRGRFTSGFAGVPVTVGSPGAAGAAGANAGGSGGTTSFGALMSCPGGNFGAAGSLFSSFPNNLGVTQPTSAPSGANIVGSIGAGGSQGMIADADFANGIQATMAVMGYSYGRGAAGAYGPRSAAARAGNVGGDGIVIVKEYA